VRFGADTRGAASQVVQVLTAGITALLISGLVLGAGTYLEGQQERATQEELNVVGERMATELSRVATLGEKPGTDSISLVVNHVQDIAGEQYLVELTTDSSVCSQQPGTTPPSCLQLRVPSNDVQVVVGLNIPAGDIDEETIVGGPVRVIYDGSADELTIEGGDSP
jgi:hypothetical protein